MEGKIECFNCYTVVGTMEKNLDLELDSPRFGFEHITFLFFFKLWAVFFITSLCLIRERKSVLKCTFSPGVLNLDCSLESPGEL